MTSFLLHSILFLSLSWCVYSTSDPLRYTKNDKTVVLLNINAKFDVTSGGNKANTLNIPSTGPMIVVTGSMTPKMNGSELINFNVAWNETKKTNQFTMSFNNTDGKWKWTNATFTTGPTKDVNETVNLEGMIGVFGNPSIKANANSSFLCTSPLDFSINTDTVKVSVSWSHFQVEVYPKGINGTFDDHSGTCAVDFDDKIVPIAVGGALGLLLLLVVIIYVISYIRDRRQQSKELRSGYNRIDHPEPNHHS